MAARTSGGLGVESGYDVALIDEQDLLPEELPEWERDALLRTYPMMLEYKDVRFRVEYDLKKRVVRLHKTAGRRRDPRHVGGFHAFKVYGS